MGTDGKPEPLGGNAAIVRGGNAVVPELIGCVGNKPDLRGGSNLGCETGNDPGDSLLPLLAGLTASGDNGTAENGSRRPWAIAGTRALALVGCSSPGTAGISFAAITGLGNAGGCPAGMGDTAVPVVAAEVEAVEVELLTWLESSEVLAQPTRKAAAPKPRSHTRRCIVATPHFKLSPG